MPKLRCPCGFIHNLSPIPDDGWITIRDKDYESLLQAETERDSLPKAKGPKEWESFVTTTKSIVALRGSLYDCPKCGRIMWEKPDEKVFHIYVPESCTDQEMDGTT